MVLVDACKVATVRFHNSSIYIVYSTSENRSLRESGFHIDRDGCAIFRTMGHIFTTIPFSFKVEDMMFSL